MDNPIEKQPRKCRSSVNLGKVNNKKECTEPKKLTDFLKDIAGRKDIPNSGQRVRKEIKLRRKKTYPLCAKGLALQSLNVDESNLLNMLERGTSMCWAVIYFYRCCGKEESGENEEKCGAFQTFHEL